MSEPTPTDLAMLAIQLAKVDRASPPADLLEAAYDMWRAADCLLKDKRKESEKQLAIKAADDERQRAMKAAEDLKETKERVADVMWRHPWSFKKILQKQMLPKSKGEKGASGYISTERGLRKALEVFFRETKRLPLEDQLNHESNIDQTKPSEAFLRKILKDKKIPPDLLDEFRAWQERRIAPKSQITL